MTTRLHRAAVFAAFTAGMTLTTPAWPSDYRDSKYGFAVSPPELSGPAPGGSAVRFAFNAAPDAGFASNMNVMIQEIKTTRDQFIALSEKQFAANGMTLRASAKRDVSGQPGVVFEYEGQMGGRGLRFLSLAVVQRERVLLVTFTAPASKFADLEAEFRRSLESFKLTNR